TLCDQSHFASRHPHLSVVQIFKEHATTSINTRQQQRSEIMKIIYTSVKSFSTFSTSTFPSRTVRNVRRFRRGAHYKDLAPAVNTLS
ncbi:MAG: hypothetical protein WBW07_00840, partial [Azonexus sp.]